MNELVDPSAGLITPIDKGNVAVEDADFYYPTRQNIQGSILKHSLDNQILTY